MPRHRRNANQKYHDRVAGKYEQIYNDAYWQWHDGLTWDYIKPHLPVNMATPIVDLGCGSGKWGRKFLKSGYRVTFVDLSAQMVREATIQAEDMGARDSSAFLQADLMDLAGLPEAHFGLAVAMGEPLCSVDKPLKAFQQIASILAPGGVLIATFDHRIACVDHYLKEGDVQALETFLKNGRTHWLTRKEEERFELHTFEPNQLRTLFASAGFEVIEMLGKTVLPMRQHRDLLEDPTARRRYAKIEKKLARDANHLARCPHLQVTVRKVS